MSRKIKFDSSKNPALNFGIIVRDLARISEESGIPMTKIITDFKEDLKNYYEEDYEKRIEDIDLSGHISPKLLSSFDTYLNKMLKLYKDKEKKDASSEKKANEDKLLQDKWRELEESIERKYNGS